ncbi:ribonuclease H-like domain-containing protein, partial [Tanacetum coccineum]
NSSQTVSTHPMVTRTKAGIFESLEHMNCHVTTTSPLSRSHVYALRDHNWKEAMLDEYNALITNRTWVLGSLYGLKQAPRAWFQWFASYTTRGGFQHSKTDSSLFIFNRGADIAYLLLYVDDIILTASFAAFLQWVISSLHAEFSMTDLGSLNYFLGISAKRTSTGMFLSQSKYVKEILERAHMQQSNPFRTLVDT